METKESQTWDYSLWTLRDYSKGTQSYLASTGSSPHSWKHHVSETGAEAGHHVMTSSQHVGSSYCEAMCTQEKHIGKIPRSLGLAIANGETWCYLINLCHMKMRSLNCKLRRIINCLQPLQATVEIHTQTACKIKRSWEDLYYRGLVLSFLVAIQEAAKQQFPTFGAAAAALKSQRKCV